MTPVDVVSIAHQQVGVGKPVFVIAEIGINHNGDIALAKQLIDVASQAGCDAVKFQKRTPVICVPLDQASTMRETPWGTMTYLEYKERIEFGQAEFSEIDAYCRSLNIMWFASPWDVPSVAFLQGFDTPVFKVASACLTDDELLVAIRNTGKPVIMSTGMSTLEEIDHAVSLLDRNKLILGQATSTYPCKPEELNLRAIAALRERFGAPVGYSGHESSVSPSLIAVSLGAIAVERHVTLNRSMWGTDHSSSLELNGMITLSQLVRKYELCIGNGKKEITAEVKKKLNDQKYW